VFFPSTITLRLGKLISSQVILNSSSGVDGQFQHDSYIASWLKVLKNDKKAIFTAAARKASEFLNQQEEEQEQAAA
jgi:antirestriction protein ArdC